MTIYAWRRLYLCVGLLFSWELRVKGIKQSELLIKEKGYNAVKSLQKR